MNTRPIACLLLLAGSAAAQLPPAWLIDSTLDRLFSVNLTTGAATLIGSTAGVLSNPVGLTWRLDTRTLWTIDSSGGEVGTLDTATGAFTHVFTAVPGTGWGGIDHDPTVGVFWLVRQGSLYRLDPGTGVTTLVGTSGATLLTGLETDPFNGRLLAVDFLDGRIYQLDKTTGAGTPILNTPPLNMQGLTYDQGHGLWATNSATDSLYRINQTTGAATLIGAHGAGIQLASGLEIALPTRAQVERSGSGCPLGVSFYERFAPGAFDLSNSNLQMTPVGTGYRVARGTSAFVPPVGTNLGLGDDTLSPPLVLPFTFPFPGGSTNQIKVCSNGFIYLNGTGTSTSFEPSAPDALSGGPRLFPLWMDLNPGGAGGVHYDTEPTRVRVTWRDVPEFNLFANRSTFQVELTATGSIEYRWLTAGNAEPTHLSLVAFSPGAGHPDPGNRDLSATLPFTTESADPLTQDAQAPLLGRTINLSVTRIPAGSLAGLELLGLPAPGGGIDLTGAGMLGCTLYVLPIAITLPFAAGGATATIPLPIPNDQSLLGSRVPVQALVVRPGINPAGIVTSNLATLVIGNG